MRIFLWAMVFVGLVIIFMIAICGCSPQKMITRQAIKHPERFAKPCASIYPVKEKVSTKEVFIQGETMFMYDTVTVDCDTVFNNSTRIVKVPVKVASIRVDTFFKETNKEGESTAGISAAQQETKKEQERAAKAEAKFDRIQGGRNTWRILALVCLALILGGVALKIAKPRIF